MIELYHATEIDSGTITNKILIPDSIVMKESQDHFLFFIKNTSFGTNVKIDNITCKSGVTLEIADVSAFNLITNTYITTNTIEYSSEITNNVLLVPGQSLAILLKYTDSYVTTKTNKLAIEVSWI